MKIFVAKNPDAMGRAAAAYAAGLINAAIASKGEARIALSTGASQFDTLKALIHEDIDWSKVVMFHLDEYVDLPITHPASFRKYLQERFVSQVNLKEVHFVDGLISSIPALNAEISKAPIDVGLIGIGENAHVAFNDPPADFEATDPYIVVDLNEDCKRQQVGEGWFDTAADVPVQAVSMSVGQIMSCKAIISCVPYSVKAKAVRDTVAGEISNMVPATILKSHPNMSLYLDEDSAAGISKEFAYEHIPGLEGYEEV